MTPLSALSLTAPAIRALANIGIESVEGLGNLTPARVHQLMPYCHAMITLAHYRQWHHQRYPSPALLMSRRGRRST